MEAVSPRQLDAKPEAVHLANWLMARRLTGFYPLTGDVLAGFKIAA